MLGVAATLVGCSSSPPTSSTASAPGTSSVAAAPSQSPATGGSVDVAAPTLGVCYDYAYLVDADPSMRTLTDGASSSDPTVPCSATHTAVTYFVGHLSGPPARASDPDDPAVLNAETEGCEHQWFTGETQASVLTRAYVFTWTPTMLQWQNGARWYRCDGVLHASFYSIVPIPADFLARVRTTAGRAEYRACLTKAFALTSCAQVHRYKAWSYRWLGHGAARFPGVPSVKAAIKKYCLQTIPPGHYYYSVWPTAVGWSHTNYSGICYDGGSAGR